MGLATGLANGSPLAVSHAEEGIDEIPEASTVEGDGNTNGNINSMDSHSFGLLNEETRKEIVALIREEKEQDAAADNKADGDDAPQGNLLPKDTYSFLVFAPFTSWSFFIASLVFLVQMFSLFIVALDQVTAGDTSESNKLGVPAFTTWPVRITQILALIIAVMYQMDILWSINVLFKGFDEAEYSAVFRYRSDARPAYLKVRWWTSNLLRLLQGFLCLAVMFMLILRAETGRNVLLSFNVINFIAGFDNAVFGLGQWGYFGGPIKESADHLFIGDCDFASVAEIKGFNLKMLRSLTVVLIWAILMSFWAWLMIRQGNGDFLPQSFYVQFGDNENSALGLLSGIYDVQVSSNDVIYVARSTTERNYTSVKSTIQFRYCRSDSFWGLEAHALDDNAGSFDVCKDFVARSPGTSSYNILSVRNAKWQVLEERRNERVELKYLRMLRRPMACPAGKYGPTCEFEELCDSLAIAATAFNLDGAWRVNEITVDNEKDVVTNFIDSMNINREEGYVEYNVLLNNKSEVVLANGRPVYTAELSSPGDSPLYRVYEVVTCIGRRWARVILAVNGERGDSETLKSKILLLEESLGGIQGETVAFRYVTHLSEAIDMGTTSDTGSPIDLKWYKTSDAANFKADVSLPADDQFVCKCDVCPDGISSIPENNLETDIQVDFAVSALDGQNLTCGDLDELHWGTARGTYRCRSLQMTSISECGCPYVLPAEQPCPLCTDGSQIAPELVDKVPFPGGFYAGGATCAELSWGGNLRGEFNMRASETYCPSWQATFGEACGCQNTPEYPCEVVCPSKGSVFEREMIVANFEPDISLNGWYCGELLGRMSWQYHQCTEEWKTALAEACCVP